MATKEDDVEDLEKFIAYCEKSAKEDLEYAKTGDEAERSYWRGHYSGTQATINDLRKLLLKKEKKKLVKV